MLLHDGDGPTLLMSIPRASLVHVPGHGTATINSAYAYGGPELLVEAVEESTGLRVDNYIEIGIGGVVDWSTPSEASGSARRRAWTTSGPVSTCSPGVSTPTGEEPSRMPGRVTPSA